MPLTSDLTLSAAKFRPEAVSDQTKKFNDGLIKIMEGGPRWFDVGAERYRQMRWNGETPLPRPQVLEHGQDTHLPSRDSGRQIPVRVFKPRDGKKARGVFYHIHGGGWVLQSEHYQDVMLDFIAENCSLIVVSVGYRLAPENPYPAGNEDCFDVGEWLVDHAEREYGVPLTIMSGDSAGAHLSVVTCFHLLKSRPDFAFKGLVLNFGCFDLSSMLPQVYHFELPLVLDKENMASYIKAYLPNTTIEQRRDPMISPLWADFSKLEKRLPPALFTCGTLDCLLDDSVFMSSKWMMSGAEAILKIYPGAPHGFNFFPVGGTEQTEMCLEDVRVFIEEHA